MTTTTLGVTERPSQLVASEIRAELGRQGRSQRWLSGVLHHNQSWVSTRVSTTATVDLTVDEIAEIASALNVPLHKFLSTLVRSYVTRARRALVRWNRRRRLGPLAVVVELDEHRLARAA